MSDVPLLLRQIWELSHALRAMSATMERDLGISGPQRLALREVAVRPGMSPGELATALCLHPSTVTGLVDRLVDRGLLNRRPRRGDRRSSELFVTEAAASLLASSAPTVEQVVTSVAALHAGADLESTSRVIGDLVHALNVQAAAPPEGPPHRPPAVIPSS